ncbi:hypothetical protein [Streptomyces sp. MK37H]|uniref:hypothetical protein n=1 Tax=Streptomyces sp. MK37H TaxID=2699117 RepID=UPI001FFA4954|nr:hypothetical protein [Streptomyces sp. MK37H]
MGTAAGEGGEGVRSVLRALDLLALFDETHRSRSVRELTDGAADPAEETAAPEQNLRAAP